MRFNPSDHTFVICAYGESPFLEDCIRSLTAQTVKSRILLATSTPSEGLTALAEKYGIPVFVNTGAGGIGGDWNFAWETAASPLLTIAHQDDLYFPGYTEAVLRRLNRAFSPVICFTGYRELRNGEVSPDNRNLRVKKLMLFLLRLFPRSVFIRRRVLSLGNPICCPAVTYVTGAIGSAPFSLTFRNSLDWDAWERFSRVRGDFAYEPAPLMAHRIHAASATSRLIDDGGRAREDYDMLRRFWPGWIARPLFRLYGKSEKSNRLG